DVVQHGQIVRLDQRHIRYDVPELARGRVDPDLVSDLQLAQPVKMPAERPSPVAGQHKVAWQTGPSSLHDRAGSLLERPGVGAPHDRLLQLDLRDVQRAEQLESVDLLPSGQRN